MLQKTGILKNTKISIKVLIKLNKIMKTNIENQICSDCCFCLYWVVEAGNIISWENKITKNLDSNIKRKK